MTIQRLNIGDADELISIMTSHDKLENTLKKYHYSSDENDIDVYLKKNINKLLLDESNAFYGYLSDDGSIKAFVFFRYWFDEEENEKCWSWIVTVRNKDQTQTYSYGQKFFSDECIQLIKHGIRIAEESGATCGYTLTINSTDWTPLIQCVKPEHCILNSQRYEASIFESIPENQYTSFQKIKENMYPVKFSTPQLVYKYKLKDKRELV